MTGEAVRLGHMMQGLKPPEAAVEPLPGWREESRAGALESGSLSGRLDAGPLPGRLAGGGGRPEGGAVATFRLLVQQSLNRVNICKRNAQE